MRAGKLPRKWLRLKRGNGTFAGSFCVRRTCNLRSCHTGGLNISLHTRGRGIEGKGARGGKKSIRLIFAVRFVAANQTESMSFHNELSYCGSSPLSHPQNRGCVSTGSEDRVSLPISIFVLSDLPHLPSLVRLAFSCPSITTWAQLLLIRPSAVDATAVSLGDARGEDGAPETKILRCDREQLQLHI